MDFPSTSDVVIVGAGAAGLATAIFAAQLGARGRIVVLEGARKPGAKILVSGGSRCNVTNTTVTETDFWGGRRSIVRRVLRGFTAADAATFFGDLGVPLHEEPGGKLFPDSNRSRDVLEALLGAAARSGIRLVTGARVVAVDRVTGGFALRTAAGSVEAQRIVLATGGRSLPKSGSDGAGYAFAQALGHTLEPQTPALAPLVLDSESPAGIHRALSGVALDAEITVWVDGRVSTRLSGALLWTHFGISGPLALNASRHWERARLEGHPASLTLNMRPGKTFEDLDAAWIAAAQARARISVRSLLAMDLPDAVGLAVLGVLGIDRDRALADLCRTDRRRLAHAIAAWPLPVVASRGYDYAEVTAGGVPLSEIDPATMESRVCPGLYLVGEILDVDGRIGGFNFQWAWSTAFAAGRALSSAASAGVNGPPASR